MQSCFYSPPLIRALAAEEDEEDEDDEGFPPEPSADEITAEVAEVAEVPKDKNEDGKEEDDDLAEYGLDRYDEEDSGESVFTIYMYFSFLLSN